MKRSSMRNALIANSAITLALVMFVSPTIMHQIFFMVGGMFSAIIIVAMGLSSSMQAEQEKPKPQRVEMTHDALVTAVRRMRDAYMDDVTIARALVVNINEIKAIK